MPTLPKIISDEDLKAIAQEHGGWGGTIDRKPSVVASANDWPTAPGATPPAKSSRGTPRTYQFQDGTSIDITWDGDTGSWVVDDWSTLGDWYAKQEKATAASTDTRQPDQKESDRIALEQQRVNLAKSQQAAAPQPGAMQSAFEDVDKTIQYIQSQIASGKITLVEGNKLMVQAKQAFQDTLTGSTAAGRAKSAADYRQNNAQLGGSMLNQRVSSGTSMANQLVSGANDAFGKILPGTGSDSMFNFNPYRLAKNFVTDLGGGPGVYNSAAQMVQGAQGQPGDDPTQPGYWMGTPEQPGDPGIPEGIDQEEGPGTVPGFTVPGLDAYNNPDVYLENRPRYAPSGSGYMANDPSTWWGG